LIDRETLGLNTKNPDLFLDTIHPDMVWPWPPTSGDHDPVRWRFVLGRFNKSGGGNTSRPSWTIMNWLITTETPSRLRSSLRKMPPLQFWILTRCGVTKIQSKRFIGRVEFVSFTRG
jgi:hypothetical protein